ncbi:hypothetical protein [Micromonospora polyrhachis]|uniref:CdiI immunity protein domain-containing protein n=1 Tax=Micromonospora polyrhachis TaxID=1282883 RepID=A0A7W7SUS5_9ACTN|nr:hypothetical protein [Micromonospora polyrhachis]MBB4961268.1 hypothetical protein [Micromonospora polyrhachis]
MISTGCWVDQRIEADRLYADLADLLRQQPKVTDGLVDEKDLYDAVLLAEDPRAKLSPSLLDEVLDPWLAAEDVPDAIDDLDVDWEDFQKDYPWVGGTGEEWLTRLSRALTHMLDTADEQH